MSKFVKYSLDKPSEAERHSEVVQAPAASRQNISVSRLSSVFLTLMFMNSYLHVEHVIV